MAGDAKTEEDVIAKAIVGSILSTVPFVDKVSVFGCICVTVDGSNTSVTVKINQDLTQFDKQLALCKDIDDSVKMLRSTTRRRSKSFDFSRQPTADSESASETTQSAFRRSASVGREMPALLTTTAVDIDIAQQESSVPCSSDVQLWRTICEGDSTENTGVDKFPSLEQQAGLDGNVSLLSYTTDPKQKQVLERALKEFLKLRYQQKQNSQQQQSSSSDGSEKSRSPAPASPVPVEFLKLVALQARIMGIAMSDVSTTPADSSDPLCKKNLAKLLKDFIDRAPKGVADLVFNSGRTTPSGDPTDESSGAGTDSAGITKQKRLSFTGNEEKYQLEQGAFAKAMQRKLTMMNGAETKHSAKDGGLPKRKSLFRTGSAENRKAFVQEMLAKAVSSPRKRQVSGGNVQNSHLYPSMGSPAKIARLVPLSDKDSNKLSVVSNCDIFRDLLPSKFIAKPEFKATTKQELNNNPVNSKYTFKPIKVQNPDELHQFSLNTKLNVPCSKEQAVSESNSSSILAADRQPIKIVPIPADAGKLNTTPTGSSSPHSFLPQSSLESLNDETDSDTDENDVPYTPHTLPFVDIDSIPDYVEDPLACIAKARAARQARGVAVTCVPEEDESSNLSTASSTGSVGFETACSLLSQSSTSGSINARNTCSVGLEVPGALPQPSVSSIAISSSKGGVGFGGPPAQRSTAATTVQPVSAAVTRKNSEHTKINACVTGRDTEHTKINTCVVKKDTEHSEINASVTEKVSKVTQSVAEKDTTELSKISPLVTRNDNELRKISPGEQKRGRQRKSKPNKLSPLPQTRVHFRAGRAVAGGNRAEHVTSESARASSTVTSHNKSCSSVASAKVPRTESSVISGVNFVSSVHCKLSPVKPSVNKHDVHMSSVNCKGARSEPSVSTSVKSVSVNSQNHEISSTRKLKTGPSDGGKEKVKFLFQCVDSAYNNHNNVNSKTSSCPVLQPNLVACTAETGFLPTVTLSTRTSAQLTPHNSKRVSADVANPTPPCSLSVVDMNKETGHAQTLRNATYRVTRNATHAAAGNLTVPGAIQNLTGVPGGTGNLTVSGTTGNLTVPGAIGKATAPTCSSSNVPHLLVRPVPVVQSVAVSKLSPHRRTPSPVSSSAHHASTRKSTLGTILTGANDVLTLNSAPSRVLKGDSEFSTHSSITYLVPDSGICASKNHIMNRLASNTQSYIAESSPHSTTCNVSNDINGVSRHQSTENSVRNSATMSVSRNNRDSSFVQNSVACTVSTDSTQAEKTSHSATDLKNGVLLSEATVSRRSRNTTRSSAGTVNSQLRDFIAGSTHVTPSDGPIFKFTAADVKKRSLAKDPWPKLPAQLSLPQASNKENDDKAAAATKSNVNPVYVESSDSQQSVAVCSPSKLPAGKSSGGTALKRRASGSGSSSSSRRKRRNNSRGGAAAAAAGDAASSGWVVPVEYRRPVQGRGRLGKTKTEATTTTTMARLDCGVGGNGSGGEAVDRMNTFKMKKYWLEMYGPGSPLANCNTTVAN